MKQVIYFSLILLSLFTTLAQADEQAGAQYKVLGPWEVHYIAFPSTFIQPSIAKNYDLDRSPNKGIINISVINCIAFNHLFKFKLLFIPTFNILR